MGKRRVSQEVVEFFAVSAVRKTRKSLILRRRFSNILWSRQLSWIQQLTYARQRFEAEPDRHWFGAADLQRLFGVSRRTATTLARRWHTDCYAGSYLVARADLEAQLAAAATTPAARWEQRRRQRLARHLADTMAQRPHSVAVPPPPPAPGRFPNPEGCAGPDFPAGDAEAYLTRLATLIQAIDQDYEGFVRWLGGPGPGV